MRAVTLMGLALAGLLAAAMPGMAAPANLGPGAANPAQPAASEPSARTVAAHPPQAGERRRTYASCNRESHRRDLRGGARRRFLIRCKLGYERRHIAPASAQVPSPAPPKRP